MTYTKLVANAATSIKVTGKLIIKVKSILYDQDGNESLFNENKKCKFGDFITLHYFY
jgi:hypothetical protein